MAEQNDVKYDFSEQTIKKRRSLPKGRIVLIVLMVALQVLCVLGIIFYRPSPQDVIDSYRVYVTPKDDGSLDVQYMFTWTPLDADEPLTFVYVGMANPDFTVIEHSDNITEVEKYDDYEGECHVDLYLDKNYYKGETLEFSFTVNQRSMLCERYGEYMYEFVPCWFNSTPISSYTFYWKQLPGERESNAETVKDGWHVWHGSMEPGEYRMMRIGYEPFDAPTVEYEPFYEGSVHNDLESERIPVIMILVIFIIVLFVFQVFCFDTVVSYHRGRGFIYGYGHPMYVYGRPNRHYRRAQEKYMETHGYGIQRRSRRQLRLCLCLRLRLCGRRTCRLQPKGYI